MLRIVVASATLCLWPGLACAAGEYGYGPQPPSGPILDLRPFLGVEAAKPPAQDWGGRARPESLGRPAQVPEPSAPNGATEARFALQMGAFGEREAAVRLRARLQALGHAWLESVELHGERLHRVRFGGFASKEAAQSQAERLLEARLVEAAVVVRLN